jgi:two-component sensor histidine kinase
MTTKNTATITLREEKAEIRRVFTSEDKPAIPRHMLTCWQQSVDTLSKIFNVSIAFVVQLQNEALKIVVVSKSEPELFRPGQLLPVNKNGIYCETTIGRDELFYIPNAEEDKNWREFANTTKFRSYAGYPVNWPDGESFGALCLLNADPREYSADLLHILQDYKRLIERDLEHLLHTQYTDTISDDMALRMREVAHRAKNHFAILSNLIQIIAAKPTIDARQTLRNIDAKMRTMSLLHEMLYSSASLELPVAQFLQDVIHVTTQLTHHKTKYTINLESLPPLDSRHVFDLSLLISELTTNTIKYFDGREDELHISFSCEVLDSSTIRLTFRDNGPGFSEEFLENPEKLGNIGFTMLRSFTRLLNGSYRLYNDNGAVTECTIRA